MGKYARIVEDLIQTAEANEVRTRAQAGRTLAGENILDLEYKQMGIDLRDVGKDSEEWTMVEKYIANTHGETHKE